MEDYSKSILAKMYDMAERYSGNEQCVNFANEAIKNISNLRLVECVYISEQLSIVKVEKRCETEINEFFIPFVNQKKISYFAKTYIEALTVGICILHNNQNTASYIKRMSEIDKNDK